jgi:long-chain fatty acid transport protein
LADSPAAVYYNPAGMIQLPKSAVSVSTALLQPKSDAKPDGGGKAKMQRDSYLLPSFFSVTTLSDRVALGVGVTSNWGLATDWGQTSFTRYNNTRFEMKNTDYLMNMAYKLTEQFSFGLGAVIDNSSVSKEKKFWQAAGDGDFKLEGNNTAAGFMVAALYKLNERHQFGIQYKSSIRRKYHGKVHLDNMSAATMSAYNFPESSYETDVVEKYTLPQSIDLGYVFKVSPQWTLAANVSWMDWSCVKKEELAYPEETDATRLAFLNIGNPANRDWHSSISFGLGTEYALSERLRLRTGYFFHQSPIPQDTFDASLPDADSQALSLGFGYDLTKAWTIDLAWGALIYDTRSVKNNVSDAAGGSQDGKYRQWINMALATASYKF